MSEKAPQRVVTDEGRMRNDPSSSIRCKQLQTLLQSSPAPFPPQLTEMDPSSSSWASLSSSGVTIEELKCFHWIDREIFGRLVLSLGREVEEAMRIIGLWLWLESMCFPNIVIKLLSLPDMVLNLIANEAINCLNALEPNNNNNNSTIKDNEELLLFTRRLLNSTAISLPFFTKNRLSAIRSISKFITEVASRAFDDIIIRAMNHRALLLNSTFGDGFNVKPSFDSSATFAPPSRADPGLELGIENINLSDPEPDVKGKQVSVGLGPSGSGLQTQSFSTPFSNSQFVVEGSSSNSSAPHPQNPLVAAAYTTEDLPEDRTLFITFSRGYPMTEKELRAFLAMNYGDCIESIYMQDVQQPHLQALFARVIVNSVVIMDLILQEADEEGKAKFVINGKHAWVRKYFPKGSNC